MKYTALFAVLIVLIPAMLKAQFLFEDATGKSKIFQHTAATENIGPGIVILDIDNDGWDDLYLSGGLDSDKLYRNNHDGTFTDIADSNFKVHNNFYSHTRGGTAFDFDNDGFTDIYATTQNTDILWRNNGNGTFTNVSQKAGMVQALEQNESNGATFGDFDGDGDNDLYVARWVNEFNFVRAPNDSVTGYAYKGFPNWFYINNGDGTFTEKAKEFGVDGDTGCSNIGMFFDYDRDGDLDLFIGNDFGIEILPNRVYKNMLMETGTATFVRVDTLIGMEQHLFSMGIGPNDYDRDGDFDFYETNIGREVLMQNNNNVFTDVGAAANIPLGYRGGDPKNKTISWTPLFADFDNDGWEDGFIVHGFISVILQTNPLSKDTSRFLWNRGGIFQDYTDSSGIMFDRRGRGASLTDYDHDGKVDIVAGSSGNNDPSGNLVNDFRIFHNITPDSRSGHWLQLKYTAVRTAKEAIGTIADVWAGGMVCSRQLSTGGGMGSVGSLTSFVGLGKYTEADSIVISWPADKYRHRTINRYYHVHADQVLHYTEDTTASTASVTLPSSAGDVKLYPSPARDILNIQNCSAPSHFEIYDVLGIRRLDFEGSEKVFSLSVGSLKPGSYLLRITSNSNSITKRFIKE
ncbi:MAG: FG-GAP-like repeat-containing protein [Bacteroidota bacterium]|nr:FG-GAP-like repeat-containing protein [Bacteroidota bacterium]MDP4228984.1 FG-GAP-like repeat-containing protein [Bacteroidota bacterium]MDP4235786.1 FG-GAP-like repeat-containing protein [Bacteroidota bacterium]